MLCHHSSGRRDACVFVHVCACVYVYVYVYVCVCVNVYDWPFATPLPSGVAIYVYLQFARVQCRQWRMHSHLTPHNTERPVRATFPAAPVCPFAVAAWESKVGLRRDSFAHATMQNCDDRMLVHWKFIRIEVVSFCRADCYVERRVVVLDRRRCFGLIDRRYWRPCQAGCCNGECTGGLA